MPMLGDKGLRMQLLMWWQATVATTTKRRKAVLPILTQTSLERTTERNILSSGLASLNKVSEPRLTYSAISRSRYSRKNAYTHKHGTISAVKSPTSYLIRGT